jgi:hypothetical protein
VSFRDFVWFAGGLFVWWNSGPAEEPDEEPVSRRSLIAILILLLVLIIASLRIIDVLRHADALQDCVMQGRTNCMPTSGL